jgi:hypothetical protein
MRAPKAKQNAAGKDETKRPRRHHQYQEHRQGPTQPQGNYSLPNQFGSAGGMGTAVQPNTAQSLPFAEAHSREHTGSGGGSGGMAPAAMAMMAQLAPQILGAGAGAGESDAPGDYTFNAAV